MHGLIGDLVVADLRSIDAEPVQVVDRSTITFLSSEC